VLAAYVDGPDDYSSIIIAYTLSSSACVRITIPNDSHQKCTTELRNSPWLSARGREEGRDEQRDGRSVGFTCREIRGSPPSAESVSAVTLTRNTLAFPFSRRAPTSAIPRQDRYRVALRERDGPFTLRRERTRNNVRKYNNTCRSCVYRAGQPASYGCRWGRRSLKHHATRPYFTSQMDVSGRT